MDRRGLQNSLFFKKCLVSLFKVCVYIYVQIYTQTLCTRWHHTHPHTEMYTCT